jgi:hypothetical protein
VDLLVRAVKFSGDLFLFMEATASMHICKVLSVGVATFSFSSLRCDVYVFSVKNSSNKLTFMHGNDSKCQIYEKDFTRSCV